MSKTQLFEDNPYGLDMNVMMEDFIKRNPEYNAKKLRKLSPPGHGKYSTEEEYDPNGRSAKQPGSKLDASKSPVFSGLLDYFPRACLAVANVSAVGASKYSWKGWEEVPDGFVRYSNALGRHLLGEAIDGMVDEATGLDHAAMVAWNSLARLEIFLRDRDAEEVGGQRHAIY